MTVHGNSSVTIDGLVVGGVYTVTEMTDWSWRYDFIEAEKSGTGITNFSYVKKTATATGTLGKSGNEITFTNSRSETVWLDGDSWCDNLFK